MADKPQRGSWTHDEIKREQAAERARARRDAARGVSKNLENAVAHTEFAKRRRGVRALAEAMTEALNPEPLLPALHGAGVCRIIIGGFAGMDAEPPYAALAPNALRRSDGTRRSITPASG